MKVIILFILIITYPLYPSSSTSNTTNFETLSSHLIIMTKQEIEKEFQELPPYAETFMLYFYPDTKELIPQSKALLSDLIKKADTKLPSMVNIISHFNKNENFELPTLRLDKVNQLLVEQSFKRQNELNLTQEPHEIFVFLMSHCCSKNSKSTVVLVGNDKVKNSIVLQNKQGSLNLDKAGATVDMKSSTKLPEEVRLMSEEEFSSRFGTINNNLPSTPKGFRVFFKEKSMELTEPSKALLPTIVETIYAKAPCIIDVIGHADTTASKKYNLTLSLDRAKSVASLLDNLGVDKRFLNLKGHGEENLFIKTADNITEAKNQNVEIFIK